MPTWPSTTVPTTNLDAGSDEPRLARADIKTMADVVNELVAYGTPSAGFPVAILSCTNPVGTLISSGLYRISLSEDLDTGSMITLSSNQFSLAAGTYSLQFAGILYQSGATTSQDIIFRNVTDSTNAYSPGEVYPATGTFTQIGGGQTYVFTLASTKTFEFRFSTTAGGDSASGNMSFIITKYA